MFSSFLQEHVCNALVLNFTWEEERVLHLAPNDILGPLMIPSQIATSFPCPPDPSSTRDFVEPPTIKFLNYVTCGATWRRFFEQSGATLNSHLAAIFWTKWRHLVVNAWLMVIFGIFVIKINMISFKTAQYWLERIGGNFKALSFFILIWKVYYVYDRNEDLIFLPTLGK